MCNHDDIGDSIVNDQETEQGRWVLHFEPVAGGVPVGWSLMGLDARGWRVKTPVCHIAT